MIIKKYQRTQLAGLPTTRLWVRVPSTDSGLGLATWVMVAYVVSPSQSLYSIETDTLSRVMAMYSLPVYNIVQMYTVTSHSRSTSMCDPRNHENHVARKCKVTLKEYRSYNFTQKVNCMGKQIPKLHTHQDILFTDGNHNHTGEGGYLGYILKMHRNTVKQKNHVPHNQNDC